MRLVIEIDLENDAFQDALRNLEITGILERLLQEYNTDTAIARPLQDCNGNTVGYIGIED